MNSTLAAQMQEELGLDEAAVAQALRKGSVALTPFFTTGLNKSFEPVVRWLRRFYSGFASGSLTQLLERDTQSFAAVLRLFEQGFDSPDAEVALWTCRIFSRLAAAVSLGRNTSLQPIAWRWLAFGFPSTAEQRITGGTIMAATGRVRKPGSSNNQGVNTGFGRTLNCFEAHPDSRTLLIPVYDLFAHGNILSLIREVIPGRFDHTVELLSFLNELLPLLAQNDTWKAILAQGGVCEHLLSLCAASLGANAVCGVDERVQALELVSTVWTSFAHYMDQQPQEREWISKSILDLIRGNCAVRLIGHASAGVSHSSQDAGSLGSDRADMEVVPLTAVTCLFRLLDTFTAGQSRFAPLCYKALIFTLIESHDTEFLRDYVSRNLCLALQQHPDIPVQVLVEPLVKQTSMHGYHNTDFDFFLVLAKHARLSIRHALLLMHLLGKIALNDMVFGRLAAVPFLVMVTRFSKDGMCSVQPLKIRSDMDSSMHCTN